MRIAVLYNAPTLAEDHPDWQSESGVLESVEAVIAALNAAGHDAHRLPARYEIAALLAALQAAAPDVVFNLCEGFAGEPRHEPHVTALLELLGIPYTGATAECLALTRDKVRTKQLLRGVGLPTAQFVSVRREEPIDERAVARLLELGKVLVKPAAEDASLGVHEDSVANNIAAVRTLVERNRAQYGDVLIEEFLPGREFNVGFVTVPTARVLPPAEIIFREAPAMGLPVVSYHAKWTPGSSAYIGTPVQCPAAIDDALRAELERLCLAACQAVGCRDYARVDFRLDEHDRPQILEINANCDLSPGAGLARALGVAGYAYDKFVCLLVEAAAKRRTGVKQHAARDQALISRQAAPFDTESVSIRPFAADDLPRLVAILESCGVFRPDEVEIAREVLEDALRQGPVGDYRVRVAEAGGQAIGWSCHGRVPLTDATHDLYWIAVDPAVQSRGVGRRLVEHIERELTREHARWLLAETSTLEIYNPTRAFYLRCGFTLLSDVPDFYRLGDGRALYGKRLDQENHLMTRSLPP